MNKKNETDYLNFEDLNTIENNIEEKTNILKEQITIPDYKKKVWVKNELPYVQEIERIEEGIDKLGEYAGKKKGWIPTKIWVDDIFPYSLETFSYKDYNRWVNNLSLVDTTVKDRTLKGIIIRFFSKIKRLISYLKVKGYTKQETTEGYNINRNWENIQYSGISTENENSIERLNKVDNYKNVLHFKNSIRWCKLVDDIPNYQTLISQNSTITIEVVAKVTNKNINVYYNSSTDYIPIDKKYKDLENGWAIYYNNFNLKNDVAPKIHISDGNGIYLAQMQIVLGNKPKDIEPYTGGQSSPNPDYPQEIEVGRGKNLFNIEKYLNDVNISYTKNNNLYICQSLGNAYSKLYKLSEEDKEITIEANIKNITSTNFRIEIFDKNGNNKGQINESTSKLTAIGNKIRFNISTNGTYSIENLLINGEPYNTLEVINKGINLLDKSKQELINLKYENNIYTAINKDNPNRLAFKIVAYNNTTIITQEQKSILSLGKYYIHFNLPQDCNKIWFSNAGTNTQSNLVINKNFKANTDYVISCNFLNIDKSNWQYTDVQLEEGTEATPYEPYHLSKVQYKLEDNFLADKDYVINGKLFKNTNELVLTGNENFLDAWGNKTNTISYLTENIPEDLVVTDETKNYLKCNYFKSIPRTPNAPTLDSEFITAGTGYIAISIQKKLLNEVSANGLKQWLKDKYNSGNPVKVIYETDKTTTQMLETVGELTISQGNNIISNSIDTENTIVYEDGNK